MAKFKNGNLVISDGKKISIGSTDITENSFTEVLSDAESYANSGDSDTLSTADVNLRSRAGNNRIVTSDSTAESGEILLVDASLGNVTIYITPENNARITVKKIDSSANQVRMASADGFVENFEIIALKNQYEYINILCDGENWWGVASNVTVRADLSYSSSSSSSSSSNSSSSSSSSLSSSSSSSSSSSTSTNANNFKFQVYYSAAGNFTLPIAAGGAGYTHTFGVSWGDGTPDSTITSYDDADATHSYADAGTYNVQIYGTCEYFAFSGGGDRLRITKLLEFNGDMGFKVLNFNGCSNLTTIVPLGTMAALTTAEKMFYNCTNAGFTTIPADLFAGCLNITTFKETFYGCSKITAIPSGLFDNNTLVTDFIQTFRQFGTSGYNIAVPTDLFRYNTLVTTFNGTFYKSASITSISADLFRYNTLVTDFTQTFSTTRVASIPTDLFRYNTLVTSFSGTFGSNTYLTGALPGDIFLYNTNVTTVQGTFNGCGNMTGLGQDVIDNFDPAPSTTTSCFLNCTSLTDYASLPAGWK